MLVLSRYEGQAVVFPGLGITVRVLSVTGGKVRLGIDAPRAIAVHREEVQRRIERQSLFGPPTLTQFACVPV